MSLRAHHRPVRAHRPERLCQPSFCGAGQCAARLTFLSRGHIIRARAQPSPLPRRQPISPCRPFRRPTAWTEAGGLSIRGIENTDAPSPGLPGIWLAGEPAGMRQLPNSWESILPGAVSSRVQSLGTRSSGSACRVWVCTGHWRQRRDDGGHQRATLPRAASADCSCRSSKMQPWHSARLRVRLRSKDLLLYSAVCGNGVWTRSPARRHDRGADRSSPAGLGRSCPALDKPPHCAAHGPCRERRRGRRRTSSLHSLPTAG